MQITITPAASHWFQSELGLKSGDSVRFFGKVYGQTAVHDGFSLGVERAEVQAPITTVTVDGITYFVGETDDWFFAGYDLHVAYNETLDEPAYQFEAQKSWPFLVSFFDVLINIEWRFWMLFAVLPH